VRVGRAVAQAEQGLEGFLDDVMIGPVGSSRAFPGDHERKAGHFAAELGHDPLRDCRPDARQGDELLEILLSIAAATSRTGRTMALKAFLTPTPSTEQINSKNSTSASFMKPTMRGVNRPCCGFPSMYSIVRRLTV